MCNMHYQRWFKRGTTADPRKLTIEQRFWVKVNKDGPVSDYRPDLGACWIWTAALTGAGYGNFTVSKGLWVPAHRFAYEMLVAKVSPELEMDHLCRVRHCVNPAHLEPVPQPVNTWRGLTPIVHNWLTTHCPAGHAYDNDNTYWYGNNRKCRKCRAEAGRRFRARKRARSQSQTG